MARTTYEWTLLDFAAWAAGLVTVPIYPTSSASQARWILQDSGAVACAVENVEQAAADQPGTRRSSPDLRAPVAVCDAGARRTGSRRRPGRPRRRGRRTPRRAGPGHASPPSSTPRAPPAAPRAASSPTATSSPRSTTPSSSSTRSSSRSARSRPRPCSSCRCRTSSAGWSPSAACAPGSGSATPRASQTEDLLADLAGFRPTFLLAIPYVLEKVFNTGRATAEKMGRAAVLRPRRQRSPGGYGEARRGRASTAPARARARACGPPAPLRPAGLPPHPRRPSAAGSGTRSAAAPRWAAASPPSSRARASRSSRATA